MFRSSDFHDIVSGRRRGVGPSLLRGALSGVEWFYSAAVRRRNRRYDRGAAEVVRVGAPVVSVGNLTLGGTGKTPLVGWIARWFAQRGVRPAIVSRGYGARSNEPNDEALELRLLLPNVPHVQNPNRVDAARKAIGEFGAQVIVLDDGFQHRRIGRDLDIVLLDATEPFGFGRVFPRGMLREPISSLGRADVVVLSRADALDAAGREALWKSVRLHAPKADVVETVHRPQRLLGSGGETAPLSSIEGQNVAAFCGIGNPAAFRRTLESCNCRLVGFREFPDHHRYSQADLASLASWAQERGATNVLCTGKDLVKLSIDRLAGLPIWAVAVELEFLTGQDTLQSRLQKLLPNESPNP